MDCFYIDCISFGTKTKRVNSKGWIQGQRHAEKTSKEALCLGLQWKVSSTPMLPSGLFWVSQKCFDVFFFTKVNTHMCLFIF